LYSVILPVDIIHATILHLADTPSDYITFVDCLFCLSEMSESDLSELIASTRAGTSAAIEALDRLCTTVAASSKPSIRMPLKLDTFSGKGDARLWVSRFHRATASWPSEERLRLFQAHLVDEAALWLDSLELMGDDGCVSAEELGEKLVETFALRFRVDDLVNRRQKRGETVALFLAELSRMAKGMDPPLASPEIIRYFVRGLRPEIRQMMPLATYDTLAHALGDAKNAERRAFELGTSGVNAVSVPHEESATLTAIDGLTLAVQQLVAQGGHKADGNRWVDGQPVCRYCAKLGHMKFECPVLRKRFASPPKGVHVVNPDNNKEGLLEYMVGERRHFLYLGDNPTAPPPSEKQAIDNTTPMTPLTSENSVVANVADGLTPDTAPIISMSIGCQMAKVLVDTGACASETSKKCVNPSTTTLTSIRSARPLAV
jgi:hypothetical protein